MLFSTPTLSNVDASYAVAEARPASEMPPVGFVSRSVRRPSV